MLSSLRGLSLVRGTSRRPAARPRALRVLVAATSLAAVAAVAAVAPGAPGAPLRAPVAAAEHVVEIGDGFFGPATLTISVGDTVTWTNVDDSPHTATAAAAFDSGNLDEGGSFSFTFDTAGTYDYVCLYHEEMRGRIVVVDADPAAPADAGASSAPAGAPQPAGQPASPDHAAGHGAGGADDGPAGDQPNTAVSAPMAMPGWAAPLLIGLGAMALATSVLPIGGAGTRIAEPASDGRRLPQRTTPSSGWRR